ncbi:MAG: orotidine-5'-phosphate decarboxylase [Pseudomonadota bacterium]
MTFADRVVAGTQTLGPLCVGIDPHPGRIPDLFGGDTPDGITAWADAMINAAVGRVAVVKPQVGLFERHGPGGMAALQHVCETARKAGLIVIADAKRGDIGSTAEGYAAAYLEPDAPFEADAITVNPYMGLDTLEPFIQRAEMHDKGVVVLARTSNPGSADFQSKSLDGAPLYVRVVDALKPTIERLRGSSEWSSLMLVVGATGPDEARTLRRNAPHALFLIPGYGSQGGGAADAVAGFVGGAGGVVNASRSVTFPAAAQTAETLADWQAAIIEAINAAQSDLKAAASET